MSNVIGFDSEGNEVTLPYNPWYYKIAGALIKRRKPCLPGNQVHLRDKMGCYTVYDVKLDYFVIRKNGTFRKEEWDNFQCLRGEGSSAESYIKRELRAQLMQSEEQVTRAKAMLASLRSSH